MTNLQKYPYALIYTYEQSNQIPLRVPDAGKMSPWQQNEFSSCSFCHQPPDAKLQPHVLLSLVSPHHQQQQQQQQPIREQQRRQHAQPGRPGQEQLQTLQQQRGGQQRHQPDVPELRRNGGGRFAVLLAEARLTIFATLICLSDIR